MLDKAIIDHQDAFAKVYFMITEAQSKAWRQINKTLIELYWNIGQYISERVATNGWVKGIVEEMAKYIATRNPSVTGFSARNIWRMKQFYETYQGNEKLSTLLTEIGWSIKSLLQKKLRELNNLTFEQETPCE